MAGSSLEKVGQHEPWPKHLGCDLEEKMQPLSINLSPSLAK